MVTPDDGYFTRNMQSKDNMVLTSDTVVYIFVPHTVIAVRSEV
jgi:hypothetical protein